MYRVAYILNVLSRCVKYRNPETVVLWISRNAFCGFWKMKTNKEGMQTGKCKLALKYYVHIGIVNSKMAKWIYYDFKDKRKYRSIFHNQST